MEASFYDRRHQPTIVTSYGLRKRNEIWTNDIIKTTNLNTLCIHLIILLWSSPIQSGISLFADEEIREIHFLEFQLDGLDKLRSYQLCGFSACRKESFVNPDAIRE